MSGVSNMVAGSMTNNTRSGRFNSYQSTNSRTNSNGNVDSEVQQNSSFGQSLGNGSAWTQNNKIWGGPTAIGSGFAKRDASRARAEEETSTFKGVSGLTATSEEDTPWTGQANGPWNPDTTSPTSTTHSGSTSPVRHRTNNNGVASMVLPEAISPYSTSRPSIRQGSSIGNRAQMKSSLDPSSGPFKYSGLPNGQSYTFNDEKENGTFRRDSFADLENGQSRFERGGSFASAQGGASREPSLPPSRQSDHNPSGFGNGYFNTNGTSTYGHTPSNSIQRPSVTGKTSSYSNNLNGAQDLDLNISAMSLNDRSPNAYLQSPRNDSFQNQIWKAGSNVAGIPNYQADAYQNGYNHMGHQRGGLERSSASPSTDLRRLPNSPKYYSENSTPPAEFDRSFAARPGSDFDRYQRPQMPYMAAPLFNTQFNGQNYHEYDLRSYQPRGFRPGPQGQFAYPHPMGPYNPGIAAPRGPARDHHDLGHGVRSVVLEEFRTNSKSTKRYELKDIYDNVVEFSGDQHGSRFIQQKLETANSDEKERIFREIQPNALQLMTDVFGNYVIQKLFEHGNQIQKRILAETMRNHVDELSVQMYGCRVVQKALEHVLADQQAELVKELEKDVLKCVKDQNGNHVIQKAIERVPAQHIRFILEAFKGQVCALAAHPFGCRVIQRMLEFCSEEDQAIILDELFTSAAMLITDQFGNYVIQHVISSGKPEDSSRIIDLVTKQLLNLSKHKFASNVVEKSIMFGTEEQRHAIVSQITALNPDGSSPLQLLMKDQYGNYVVQKLLEQLKGDERERLIELIKPQLLALKKYNFGKQIAAIEKLIFTGPITAASYAPARSMAPKAPTTDGIDSVAPTPSLTTEENSPQSSKAPSTSASTVDGPTDGNIEKEVNPEVRIGGDDL